MIVWYSYIKSYIFRWGIKVVSTELTFENMLKQLQNFPDEFIEHELMGLIVEVKYRVDHYDCEVFESILNGLMGRVDYRQG